MSRRGLAIGIAGLLAVASAAAAARGGGGAPGGMSAGHMSAGGMANANGPTAADRDHGLDRAGDRMSDAGAGHEKARRAPGKSQHQHRRAPAPRVQPHVQP
ncbi:MAG: hypothetical protein PHY45_00770 [Rhodocyclaceae bacterium]|nr:hypothetical protein [Rhodocyclaceae bacterium]